MTLGEEITLYQEYMIQLHKLKGSAPKFARFQLVRPTKFPFLLCLIVCVLGEARRLIRALGPDTRCSCGASLMALLLLIRIELYRFCVRSKVR